MLLDDRFHKQGRKGSAMIELVLGMFPLVLMFGLLLWISQFAWQLPSHHCAVRNEVWSQRYTDSNTDLKVFDFQDQTSLEVARKARVTGIGPAFELFPDISAKTWILVSSWDHRILKLDRPPHWNLAKQLSLKALPERFRGLVAGASPRLNSLADAIRQEAFRAAAVLAPVQELVEQLEQFLPGVRARNDELQSEGRREAERARQEFEASRELLVAETNVARQVLGEHDRLIEQRMTEFEAASRKLAEAEEAEKEAIQKRIDQLDDEVLPQLRDQRIKFLEQVEEAEQRLRDFDSLEPPPID